MLDIEDIDPTEENDGPWQLWYAVSEALIDDARAGARRGDQASLEQGQACMDVMTSGPMLQWNCSFIGHEPGMVAQLFRREIGVGGRGGA